MKRSDFSRTLRQMETAAELAETAESRSERRRLRDDYAAMLKSIRPYIENPKLLEEDEDPQAAAREAAAWKAAR